MKTKGHNNSLYFKILFVISLGILLFIAAITYKHINTISESTDLIVKTQTVNLKLEQLLSTLKDAETGIRGYILTYNPLYLEPYKGSKTRIMSLHNQLMKLTIDNKKQQDNLKTLLNLINKRYSYFDAIINNSFVIVPTQNEQLKENIKHGKIIMDSIRSETDIMIRMETQNVANNYNSYQHQTTFTPLFIIGMVFFVLFLLIFSFSKINTVVRKLQLSNDSLLFSRTSSDQAEILGNYSSWLWNLDSDKINFSNNHYRLLGCEPQSFGATNENFLNFVHPEDYEMVKKAYEEIILNEHLETIYFRIIQKDGTIRFLKSSGKLLFDSYKNRNIVGNTSDITEERLVNLAIEARNLELEQSNSELASFNHVASHDLQEPLRKIQTFISRFSDEDKANLSENAKGYFVKIEIALSRMRTLIDDLLLYSRANKSEKVFEKIDLNDIFENAKQELSQDISDKNASIESRGLPKLSIIPFQMQQLFVNLIGNSLKYSDPSRTPKIVILSEKILASDYPILSKPVSKHYYKIAFTDNGLGFEQEYAEKIFILFNRLHQSKNYLGTGIGLTICKKITENHYGYLSATGTLNKGATFNLFLPA